MFVTLQAWAKAGSFCRSRLPNDHEVATTKSCIRTRVFTLPPTTIVGSNPARSRTVATIDVVVVFSVRAGDCDAILKTHRSESISALWMTGIWRLTASRTSTLSGLITVDQHFT
jgi:hypothetical protein